MKIIGKKLSRKEFTDYVNKKDFGSIPPSKMVIHHTWKPTKKEWNGSKSIEALKKYYEGLGWQAGPHIFVAEDGIWLFTDMYEVGIHAGTGNAQWEANGKTWDGWGDDFKNNKLIWYSIGIEVVGNYDAEKWSGETKTNALHVINVLRNKLNIKGLDFHRNYSTKSCPGASITKEWIEKELKEPTKEVESFIDKYLEKIAKILNFDFGDKINENEASKIVKELEKKITKLRNENQALSQQVDKATRLLEREIGECVDIDQLYKDESGWKGRA